MLKASTTEVLVLEMVLCGIEVLKAPFLKFPSWMPFAMAFWREEKMEEALYGDVLGVGVDILWMSGFRKLWP